MERPIFQPIGSPAEELDTPALVVDLGIMEQNIAVLHNAFGATLAMDRALAGSSFALMSPVMAALKSPSSSCPQQATLAACRLALWRKPRHLPTPAKTSPPDDLAASLYRAIDDILIAGRVVTPAKISRLVALAGRITLSVAVDNPRNVQDLSQAAQAAGVTLGILVDMDAGYGFGGVVSEQDAVDLARTVTNAPGLSLAGIMTYEGPLPITDRAELEAETRRRLQPILDTRGALEAGRYGDCDGKRGKHL